MKPIHAQPRRRGAATIFMAVTVVGLGAMSLGLLAMNLSVEREQRGVQRDLTSFYAAEAGISLAFQDVLNGGDGTVGSAEDPVPYGNASYFVQATSLGGFQTSLVATGAADGATSRAELIVMRKATGLFQYAAFGDEGVLLNSAALIDSYRSNEGTYASQYSMGVGYANAKGHVGSNKDIVMEANTKIAGNVSPGPTGILDADAPKTYVIGTTNPLPFEVELPAIEVPTLTAGLSISTTADTTIPTGDQYIPSILVGGHDTLTIVGPAQIVTDSLTMSTGSALVLDATNGPIELISTGDFVLSSNATVTTHSAALNDIAVKLTADNWGEGDDGSLIELHSNSDFKGTIYAPNAFVDINSNFEIFGGVIADFVSLSSNSMVHYDEDLAEGDGTAEMEFETLLWRPLGD
jgi:hypothetical protein